MSTTTRRVIAIVCLSSWGHLLTVEDLGILLVLLQAVLLVVSIAMFIPDEATPTPRPPSRGAWPVPPREPLAPESRSARPPTTADRALHSQKRVPNVQHHHRPT